VPLAAVPPRPRSAGTVSPWSDRAAAEPTEVAVVADHCGPTG
jgi:serine/threonine-protein kinase